MQRNHWLERQNFWRILKNFEIDGVLFPYSSRENRYVYEYQIKKEFPQFYHKIETILTGGEYSTKSVEIASSILEQLSDEGSISWKQFDLIIKILPTDFCKDGHLVRVRKYKNDSREILNGVYSVASYVGDFYVESSFMERAENQNSYAYYIYKKETGDDF